MNVAIILAGGTGSRFAGNMPKQYSQLLDKEVIAYSIDTIRSSRSIDELIVACGDEFAGGLKAKYNVVCVTGGATRNASLKNGLDYIAKNHPSCEKVFINEAARPFIDSGLVDDYFKLLDEYDAVITTQHITDSLGREGEAVTDRRGYYLIQAPEAFCFDKLYKHFEAGSPITATVQQLPTDCKVYRNFGFRHNLKITYPKDLVIAEALMRCLN